MACKFVKDKPKALTTSPALLSDEDLVRFLEEDHVRRSSCRKVDVSALSIARDDITLPHEEKIGAEIFDFFYDPKVAAAKLDVLSDLDSSKIDKSALTTTINIIDRRKAKRKR